MSQTGDDPDHDVHALGHVLGVQHHHVEQSVVEQDVVLEPQDGPDDHAAVRHQHGGRIGFQGLTVQSDAVVHHLEPPDNEIPGARHVGSHPPAALRSAGGVGHQLGVYTGARSDREVGIASLAGHESQIDAPRRAAHGDLRGLGRVSREPHVAGEQVAGSARYESHRHFGPHDSLDRLHRRAVAAVDRDEVHAVLHPHPRQVAGVPRPVGTRNVEVPAFLGEDPAHLAHHFRIGPGGDWIEDQQYAGH